MKAELIPLKAHVHDRKRKNIPWREEKAHQAYTTFQLRIRHFKMYGGISTFSRFLQVRVPYNVLADCRIQRIHRRSDKISFGDASLRLPVVHFSAFLLPIQNDHRWVGSMSCSSSDAYRLQAEYSLKIIRQQKSIKNLPFH